MEARIREERNVKWRMCKRGVESRTEDVVF
jgi:hypothetical protein